MNIRIVIGGLSIEATLYETPTARKVAELLPLHAKFNTWGEEIYFEVPVDEDLDDSASEEVQVGDLGYWPTGNAFCIFSGPTPVSKGGKILPASAVNIIGKVIGDARRFREVLDEREVSLEPIHH
jgi:hypothetical protein